MFFELFYFLEVLRQFLPFFLQQNSFIKNPQEVDFYFEFLFFHQLKNFKLAFKGERSLLSFNKFDR